MSLTHFTNGQKVYHLGMGLTGTVESVHDRVEDTTSPDHKLVKPAVYAHVRWHDGRRFTVHCTECEDAAYIPDALDLLMLDLSGVKRCVSRVPNYTREIGHGRRGTLG